MSISNYGKVYNLGHYALEHLLDGPVTIEEKIDGSQFSFSRQGDELVCRSRGQTLNLEAPEKLFVKAVESAKAVFDKLQDRWIYRGEYLMKPKHNTLKYDRVPTNYIMIFDIDTGDQHYLDPEAKKVEAERLGFECVPWIYRGKFTDFEEFKELLDRESILGGTKIEGVVIKNYTQFGKDGKSLKGKFVSEAFKESHQKDWKNRNPAGVDIKIQIAEDLATEARWEKAIQHLRERGELANDVKDIGPLLKEIQQDTLTECQEDIKERLFKWAWQDIVRKVTNGFPQWYKEKLAKEQFND